MVKSFQEVVVLARSLPLGAVLSINDVQMERRDTGSLSGYFTDPVQVTTMTLTQALGSRTVLTPQVLKAPIVIRRRQSVTLVVIANGLEVRMTGEALSDASAGQLVKVRNLASKRVVEGTVSPEGVIFVQGH
jgi:flagella basal body P-ring formation protein FlgA